MRGARSRPFDKSGLTLKPPPAGVLGGNTLIAFHFKPFTENIH